MKFTKELLEKAKTAKTAEELLAMAKSEGVELTAEEAEKAFADLHKTGELSDDELDNASGGSCGGNPSSSGEVDSEEAVVFLYEIGQQVEWLNGICGQTTVSTIVGRYVEKTDSGRYAPRYKVKINDASPRDAMKEFSIAQSEIQIP